jgi:hypothetical protein
VNYVAIPVPPVKVLMKMIVRIVMITEHYKMMENAFVINGVTLKIWNLLVACVKIPV